MNNFWYDLFAAIGFIVFVLILSLILTAIFFKFFRRYF